MFIPQFLNDVNECHESLQPFTNERSLMDCHNSVPVRQSGRAVGSSGGVVADFGHGLFFLLPRAECPVVLVLQGGGEGRGDHARDPLRTLVRNGGALLLAQFPETR